MDSKCFYSSLLGEKRVSRDLYKSSQDFASRLSKNLWGPLIIQVITVQPATCLVKLSTWSKEIWIFSLILKLSYVIWGMIVLLFWKLPFFFFVLETVNRYNKAEKKDKIKQMHWGILESLRAYLSKKLLKLGSAKLEVVRSAPPTRSLGKDLIKKKKKSEKESIWWTIA